MYSGKTLNAFDAQKIGLVNEIIDDGDSGRNQLIKKLRIEIAKYKLVSKFHLFLNYDIQSKFYFNQILYIIAYSVYQIYDA